MKPTEIKNEQQWNEYQKYREIHYVAKILSPKQQQMPALLDQPPP